MGEPYELPSDEEAHFQTAAPSVGRVVHQVAQGSADGKYAPVARPAIMTSVVDDWTVNLFVMTDMGTFHLQDCRYHPGDPADDEALREKWPVFYRERANGRAYPPGTWHWPPRV